MIPYLKITSFCILCDSCRLICPEEAISTDSKIYVIDSWSCTLCSICVEICPTECIKLEEEVEELKTQTKEAKKSR